MTPDPHLVPVGKIVRPHGVRGALKVFPYGETLAQLEAGAKLFLRPAPKGAPEAVAIVSVRPQGKLLVLQVAELASMDDAQAAVGAELLVPDDLLPQPEEGEYYHYQLIGLRVETVQGEPIGTLRGIIETAAHDVYVCEAGDREILIPAVEGVICAVDLEQGRMVVDLPEGLQD